MGLWGIADTTKSFGRSRWGRIILRIVLIHLDLNFPSYFVEGVVGAVLRIKKFRMGFLRQLGLEMKNA
jgi:hypothetical protein